MYFLPVRLTLRYGEPTTKAYALVSGSINNKVTFQLIFTPLNNALGFQTNGMLDAWVKVEKGLIVEGLPDRSEYPFCVPLGGTKR